MNYLTKGATSLEELAKALEKKASFNVVIFPDDDDENAYLICMDKNGKYGCYKELVHKFKSPTHPSNKDEAKVFLKEEESCEEEIQKKAEEWRVYFSNLGFKVEEINSEIIKK